MKTADSFHLLPLLEEGGITLGDAGGVVNGEVGSKERHCHTVVVAGRVVGNRLQAVALFVRQALRARSVERDTQTLAGQGYGGV